MLVNVNLSRVVTFGELAIGETFTVKTNNCCYMKIKHTDCCSGVYALNLASGNFFMLASDTQVHPINLKVVNND